VRLRPNSVCNARPPVRTVLWFGDRTPISAVLLLRSRVFLITTSVFRLDDFSSFGSRWLTRLGRLAILERVQNVLRFCAVRSCMLRHNSRSDAPLSGKSQEMPTFLGNVHRFLHIPLHWTHASASPHRSSTSSCQVCSPGWFPGSFLRIPVFFEHTRITALRVPPAVTWLTVYRRPKFVQAPTIHFAQPFNMVQDNAP